MSYRKDWASWITHDAQRYGIDPKAAIAIALHEGLSGNVGDGGHAFGPFQLNDAGGVLTNRGGDHRAFAESRAGVDWALSKMSAAGANGLTGRAAVQAIASKFERPANVGAEIADAWSHYGNGPGASGGFAPTGNLPVGTAAPQQGNGAASGDPRKMLAMTLLGAASNGGMMDAGSLLGLSMARKMQGAAQQTFQPGVSPGQAIGAQATPNSLLPFMGNTQGVKGGLLGKISSAASAVGATKIKVTSGYRDPQHNAAVGGATHSNHMTGDALDGFAFIPNRGWVPLGQAVAPVAGKFGIRSGATFNWGGKPDIWHVDDAANQ